MNQVFGIKNHLYLMKRYNNFIYESIEFSPEDEKIWEDTFLRIVDLDNLHITFKLNESPKYIFYYNDIEPNFNKEDYVFCRYENEFWISSTLTYINKDILKKLIEKYLNIKDVEIYKT